MGDLSDYVLAAGSATYFVGCEAQGVPSGNLSLADIAMYVGVGSIVAVASAISVVEYSKYAERQCRKNGRPPMGLNRIPWQVGRSIRNGIRRR